MASLFTRGYQSTVNNTPVEDGKFRFAYDSGRLYIDINDARVEISDFIKGLNYEEIIHLQNPLPKMYLAADTKQFMMYDTAEGKWICYSGSQYVARALSDKRNQNIDKTYIKDIKFDEAGNIILVYGDGTEIKTESGTSPSSLILLMDERVSALEQKMQALLEYVDVVDENDQSLLERINEAYDDNSPSSLILAMDSRISILEEKMDILLEHIEINEEENT